MKRPMACVISGVCILTLIIILSGSACSSDRAPSAAQLKQVAGASAAVLLKNLKQAYNEKNVTAFGALLDEDYEYVFFQGDHETPDPLKRVSKTDEIEIHRRMFGEQMEYIRLSFEIEKNDIVLDESFSGKYENAVWRLEVSDLVMECAGQIYGDPDSPKLTYHSDIASVIFWFRQASPDDPAMGKSEWTILRQEQNSPDRVKQSG
jgi:hypothetical protein